MKFSLVQLSALKGPGAPSPLRGAQVTRLLDGTDVAPAKIVEVEEGEKKMMVPNPSYSAWIVRDQQVMGWLLNTLSPEMLPHFFEHTSTAEVWGTITSMFTPVSGSKVTHLQTVLNKTKKKKDMTTAEYFTKMKGLCCELAAAGNPIDDDELIGYILNGLDGTYNDVVAAVNG